MRTDPSKTPDLWDTSRPGTFRVPGSPDPGEWVNLEFFEAELPINRIVAWHWHRPSDGPAHWEGARLGKHTLVSLEPLHLEPSLGCHSGCPQHGWIRNGRWTDA